MHNNLHHATTWPSHGACFKMRIKLSLVYHVLLTYQSALVHETTDLNKIHEKC